YDGLLDPLGSSQILPYLYGIAQHPRSIHIISFEKPARLLEGEAILRLKLAELGIKWTPLSFTQGYGAAGKVWDLTRMYFWGARIALFERLGLVHARGHAAAQVGLFLKQRFGLKLIFDFRGLWVDERVDKGGWDLNKLTHRWQYRYYKFIEHSLLRKADQIVVLTAAVVDEVVKLGAALEKITVIPCCADFDHFILADSLTRESARIELCLPQNAIVLGYLGSVGRMYMSDRFFRLVELAAVNNSKVYVLALTPDVKRFNVEMQKYLSAKLHKDVKLLSVSRADVSRLLPAIDLLISFIQPSYARIASSPTKLAESFAAGIPAICNFGVGDVTTIIAELDAGLVIDAGSDNALIEVSARLLEIIAKGGVRLRLAARGMLGLEVANLRYRSVYEKLE
ncbi:MAG: glycosyltransferase, partial [Methylomonas sp.]